MNKTANTQNTKDVRISTSDEIQTRLSKMSQTEKEGHIDWYEAALDNGFGYEITADDRALYNAIIEERANKEAQHPSLNDKIQSAEARQSNQDVLNKDNAPEQSR